MTLEQLHDVDRYGFELPDRDEIFISLDGRILDIEALDKAERQNISLWISKSLMGKRDRNVNGILVTRRSLLFKTAFQNHINMVIMS